MKIIDLHCDTITLLKEKNERLDCNQYHIDMDKLIKGNYLLQNFAIFTNTKYIEHKKEYVKECIEYYNEQIKLNDEYIKPIYCYQDIVNNMNKDKISSMLTLEEGDVMDDIDCLKGYYDLGVRMIAPLWNYKNRIGTPAVIDQEEGLSLYGISYIKEMERLHIIIDVSHLNDQGIRDVLKYTTKPIVATHSNSRTMTNVPRNLPDDLIKEIHLRNGIIGINYYEKFLGGSTIENIIKHIDYIVSISSIDVIALGSDFDGIDGELELKDASYMNVFIEALKEYGYNEEDIEKICFKNALRVYKEVLI